MLTPAIPKFRHRRTRPARQTKTPPVTGNRIISVAHGGAAGDDAVIVFVNGAVVGIDESDDRFQVNVEGNWMPAIGTNLDTPGQVLVLFAQDVSSAAQWRVPDPGLWHFDDAQPMEEPFEGTIS
jgi:hypothetical protein